MQFVVYQLSSTFRALYVTVEHVGSSSSGKHQVNHGLCREEWGIDAIFIDKLKHLLHLSTELAIFSKYVAKQHKLPCSLSYNCEDQSCLHINYPKNSQSVHTLIAHKKLEYRRVLYKKFCKKGTWRLTVWGKVLYLRARVVRAHQSRVRIS